MMLFVKILSSTAADPPFQRQGSSKTTSE